MKMNAFKQSFLFLLLLSWHILFAPDVEAHLAEQPLVLRGQVVCFQCWFEADRKTVPYGTAEDIACAEVCGKQGIPKALAVAEQDKTTLYLLEYGRLKKRRDGWQSYVTKYVEVTGRIRKDGDKHWLKVDSLTVVSSPSAESSAALPTEAPELTLTDMGGAQQRLSAARGKIIVLNFWATWCLPCQKEMPVLVKLQNAYAAWNVQVIGASADEVARRALVIEFTRKHKINFPVWLGATTDDMQRFGLKPELPGTVVIDRDGKIVDRINGVVTEKALEKILNELLARSTSETDHPPHHQHRADAGRSSSVPS
ncbi:MAG: TlpA disulfide reductase family protein [Acidobacteriota bacterium]|nr:TlpA family protein disulfide reductase [Blastocatellia bacterium]MDW8239487.1 TlpA disulfide reductase family protein [Acidobacteriota bacterium]